MSSKHLHASLSAAGLKNSSPDRFRIRRQRKGKGFVYHYARGRLVRGSRVLQRIRSLAIPPAWTEVVICDQSKGHLQAVGRDARGRKQYLYHPKWRQRRDHEKYSRLLGFARVLPRIRQRVRRDLQQRGLTKAKALAAVVRLLELSRIRVGNEEYARDNRSFGLTTFRNRHLCLRGHTMRFQFRGKSGKHHEIELRDSCLAKVLARCLELPGQELFQYMDERGKRRRITAGDVNEYLREISDGDFTAKDFRTWAGTVLAAKAFGNSHLRAASQARARQEIKRVVHMVAERLGNTPAICRNSYIHPAVIRAFLADTQPAQRCHGTRIGRTRRSGGLRRSEADVVRLLQRHSGAAVGTINGGRG